MFKDYAEQESPGEPLKHPLVTVACLLVLLLAAGSMAAAIVVLSHP